MRFSADFIAALREQVPLSQIVGRTVTWDRRKSQPGRGDYWACCPFHQEKTPSFHVDDRKGFYHCFGCQASGDHLRFLTEHKGLEFLDAMRELADLAGVPLEQEPQADNAAHTRQRRGRDALEAAASLYEATLWSASGQAARAYAGERGFSEETLRGFGFGVSPAMRTFLTRGLEREGFASSELERVGLVVRGEDGVRDRFRGRLMVPIHDARGRLVGFGGRSLDGREPKYLNSPQGPHFDKSQLLYNAHRARGAAHRTGRLYIVEGYLDAVALAQAGIEAVVASLGTALTEPQIEAAWQLAEEPVLCFDGDKAGRAAAFRAMERIVPRLSGGRSFQFLALPEGEDPDDVVRRGGAMAFEALAKRAAPLVDAVFDRQSERGPDTPERLAAMEARLEAIAASIPDQRVARHYREAFRERAFALRRAGALSRPARPARSARSAQPGRSRQPGRSGWAGHPTSAIGAPPTPVPVPGPADGGLLELERIALGLLVLRPAFLERFGEELDERAFAGPPHAGFVAMLLDAYASRAPETTDALIAALPQRASASLNEIWGEPHEAVGRQLRMRFAILDCDPDDAFLERCLRLFLDRLKLRSEVAELAHEPTRLIPTDGGAESRLLSLSAAVEAHENALAEEERALAEEATALRRARALALESLRPPQSA